MIIKPVGGANDVALLSTAMQVNRRLPSVGEPGRLNVGVKSLLSSISSSCTKAGAAKLDELDDELLNDDDDELLKDDELLEDDDAPPEYVIVKVAAVCPLPTSPVCLEPPELAVPLSLHTTPKALPDAHVGWLTIS